MMHYYDKYGYSRGRGENYSLLGGGGATIRVNTVFDIYANNDQMQRDEPLS